MCTLIVVENITNESAYEWTIPRNLIMDYYIVKIEAKEYPQARAGFTDVIGIYVEKPAIDGELILSDDSPQSLLSGFTLTLATGLALTLLLRVLD